MIILHRRPTTCSHVCNLREMTRGDAGLAEGVAMPAHLRVSVPDRAGSLAALTTALASAGANVVSVTVVERESGRAVDDLVSGTLDRAH